MVCGLREEHQYPLLHENAAARAAAIASAEDGSESSSESEL